MKAGDKIERRTLKNWHEQGHKIHMHIAQLTKSIFCYQNSWASESFVYPKINAR